MKKILLSSIALFLIVSTLYADVLSDFKDAKAFYKARNYQQAAQLFASAASTDSIVQDFSLYYLANCYEKLNKTEQAVRWSEQLLSKYPGFPLIGSAKRRISDDHFNNADWQYFTANSLWAKIMEFSSRSDWGRMQTGLMKYAELYPSANLTRINYYLGLASLNVSRPQDA
ncbi:MAG: tetratricopeptide repeat protein, partial [Candidatus Margulisiibacteriota bacterium]